MKNFLWSTPTPVADTVLSPSLFILLPNSSSWQHFSRVRLAKTATGAGALWLLGWFLFTLRVMQRSADFTSSSTHTHTHSCALSNCMCVCCRCCFFFFFFTVIFCRYFVIYLFFRFVDIFYALTPDSRAVNKSLTLTHTHRTHSHRHIHRKFSTRSRRRTRAKSWRRVINHHRTLQLQLPWTGKWRIDASKVWIEWYI